MDKGMFWMGMSFFIIEILAVITLQLLNMGINLSDLLIYGFGGFVVLSMNIVAGVLIAKST